jgi:hypothetical protein
VNRYVIAFGAGILIVAAVWLFEQRRTHRDTPLQTDDRAPRQFDAFEEPSPDESGRQPTAPAPRAKSPTAWDGAWEVAREGDGPQIQFVDPLTGQGTPARLVVGAPGMWPPTELWTDSEGIVSLPDPSARTLRGAPVATWEVLARSLTGDRAYWGILTRDALKADGASRPEPVKLVSANDIEVRIVDREDRPVDGAQVRLSRQAIGFVHLSRRTGTEGACLFETIPRGTFRISGRNARVGSGSHRLDYDGRGETTVVIRLVKEAGLAMPSGEGYLGPVETDPERTQDEEPGGVETRLYATDEWGGAVDGALIQVWKGDRMVFEATSRGTDPVIAGLQEDQSYRVVVRGARYGEGSQRVVGGESGEVIVEMDQPLFSIPLPASRVGDADKIEAILGQPLVQDGSAWLVDATDPSSPAMSAGLKRGDALVSIWKGAAGDWRVLVRRDGGFREVVIPAD